LILAGFVGWGGETSAQSTLPLTINGSPTSVVLPLGGEAILLSDSNATIHAYGNLDCSGPTTGFPSIGQRDEYGSPTVPTQLAFRAELNGATSACLWVRWRASNEVPTLSINGSSGPVTVSTGTAVTATLVDPNFGTSSVLFFDNADCAGDPLYQAPGYLTIVSYQQGFTGSFRATFMVTEDLGKTADYTGSCIPVTWAYDGLGGAPATPVPDTQGPILVDSGTTGNAPSGGGGEQEEPVTALPNTGAGTDSSHPFPWIIGACVVVGAGVAVWQKRRSPLKP